jgi:hypothetical protein
VRRFRLVIVSSDLDELLETRDRRHVGRAVGLFDRDNRSHDKIMQSPGFSATHPTADIQGIEVRKKSRLRRRSFNHISIVQRAGATKQLYSAHLAKTFCQIGTA